MIKKKIELLAPAGSPEAYKAAVAAGADAVYLGAKAFNARQQADNFDDKALTAVIEDAHIRGVKIYLVLNTLIGDRELKEAALLASFVNNKGIDGIIVQDLGLAGNLKEIAPGLPIHASTQMTIHNIDGVKAAQALGISRIVLSRELNLKEIETIIQKTGIEAEIFIHGALCISRSGQCLLSSFIGGRSGNRGRCAQPCRLPYKIEGQDSNTGPYVLSPKDLMTLQILPDIVKAGVSSLKIEGRMKSAEYVAAAVMVYRRYLDMALSSAAEYKVNHEDIRMLQQVFNRGGFTTGYLKDMDMKSLISTEHPKHWGINAATVMQYEKDYKHRHFGGKDNKLIRMKLNESIHIGDGLEIWDSKNKNPSAIISVMMKDGYHVKNTKRGDALLVGNFKSDVTPGSPVYKTYNKKLMDQLSEFAAKNVPNIAVKGEFSLFSGEMPLLKVTDKQGNSVNIKGNETVQEATGKPVTEQRISEQLKKTGDTPYFFDSVKVLTDNKSFIPVSIINEIRRKALLELSKKRIAAPAKHSSVKPEDIYSPGNNQVLSSKRKVSLLFYKIPQAIKWDLLPADRIYLGAEGFGFLSEIQKRGLEVYAWVPAVLNDEQMDWFVKRIACLNSKPDGILAGNLGVLHRMREEFPDIPVVVDFQMNIFNSKAIEVLSKYKPSGIMPSLELNFDQLSEIKSLEIPLEAYVYGRIPVMTLEYCPGNTIGVCSEKCGTCQNSSGYLTDRVGKRFLYKRDSKLKRTTLYNSSILMLNDIKPFEKTDVKIIRIGIMNESADETIEICRYYRELWVNRRNESEFQLNDFLEKLKGKGLTKGHYYRGVE